MDKTTLLKNFKAKLENTGSLKDLQKLKIEYLGRKGKVNALFKKITSLSIDKRKKLAAGLNKIKSEIKALINSKEEEFLSKEGSDYFDPTLPGKKYEKGSLHIVTYAIEEISRIFQKIGFMRVSYPEVEWEYFSFEALNMPKGHPARDDFETFFLDAPISNKYGRMLLTPHTSSGQVREMLRIKKPPIRMINIAKTYRPNWDVTHVPMFHQFEGLCIDRGINITHLKGTIEYFAKEFFGRDRQIRLRPFHFQFTEPSFEIDVSCGVCGGTGMINGKKCKVCKSGWLELGGAGMVHPNVLKAGGIDSRKYTGWAFGFGPERCIMMREGLTIDDIRILYDGDIRFLGQF